MSDMW